MEHIIIFSIKFNENIFNVMASHLGEIFFRNELRWLVNFQIKELCVRILA